MEPRQYDIAVRLAVADLLSDYAACIDADGLERWPDFFTENAVYQITTAYNHARGLPIGIVYADNRRMLEDRVAALRKANVYEPQRYRHVVSAARIGGGEAGLVKAEASFLVVRTMVDGSQFLFATGRYLDQIDFSGDRPRFAEKLVVLDSDKVDTLLAIPL
jgi:3-phenylpropionate/cinnamic acid dioxygenase small subunit